MLVIRRSDVGPEYESVGCETYTRCGRVDQVKIAAELEQAKLDKKDLERWHR